MILGGSADIKFQAPSDLKACTKLPNSPMYYQDIKLTDDQTCCYVLVAGYAV